jgi:hypothetical protein
MEIIKKFNDLIYNKQEYKFHDSTLLGLNINFENNTIGIFIEFCKKIDNKYGNLINLKFYFKEVRDIQLYNGLNFFGIEGDIYDFTINGDKNIGSIIKITGSNGWEFSFSAIDFDYEEKFIEKVEL